MESPERRAAISGMGQSAIGRRLGRDPLELTLDACLAAIADAGLTPRDIDGLATYPGAMGGAPGFTGAGLVDVHDALRLELDWYTGGIELPGQLGSVIDACAAVATGLANHVLCFRSVWEGTAQGKGGRSGIGIGEGGAGGGQGFRASGSTMAYTLPFSVLFGRELDRADGAATLPRVRHHARAAGLDRAERAAQRRRQPERDLPRPADARRLSRRAHDLDAVLPLRLRRSVRRCDCARRVAAGASPRPARARRCASRPWARRCAAGPRGTSSTI